MYKIRYKYICMHLKIISVEGHRTDRSILVNFQMAVIFLAQNIILCLVQNLIFQCHTAFSRMVLSLHSLHIFKISMM